LVPAVLLALFFSLGAGPANLAQRAEQKLHSIDVNGQSAHPDPRPTELFEAEINAYLASGKVQLPAGVETLRLVGTTGVVTAHCRVDFDRVRSGRNNANPLLRLFSGVHDVVVEAQAAGTNRQGRVHVNSVAIDEIEVPHFLLQVFVDKYITPRYPGVGLDSTFSLPDKIETATVGQHRLTVVQR
jgi:hypothetical protein